MHIKLYDVYIFMAPNLEDTCVFYTRPTSSLDVPNNSVTLKYVFYATLGMENLQSEFLTSLVIPPSQPMLLSAFSFRNGLFFMLF